MPRRQEAPLSDTVIQAVRVATPTLEQFAERSGIGYSTLRDWLRQAEAGEARTPRRPTVDKLAAAIKQQRDDLDRLLRDLQRAG